MQRLLSIGSVGSTAAAAQMEQGAGRQHAPRCAVSAALACTAAQLQHALQHGLYNGSLQTPEQQAAAVAAFDEAALSQLQPTLLRVLATLAAELASAQQPYKAAGAGSTESSSQPVPAEAEAMEGAATAAGHVLARCHHPWMWPLH